MNFKEQEGSGNPERIPENDNQEQKPAILKSINEAFEEIENEKKQEQIAKSGNQPVQNAKQSDNYAAIQQIKDCLLKDYRLRYNQVSNKIEYRFSENSSKGNDVGEHFELNDERFCSMMLDLQKQCDGRVTKELLRTIISSDFVSSYNPFVEYFERVIQLPIEEDYITILADRVEATDQKHFRKYFRLWFIALVAGLLDFRTENQTVLLFKGAQGIGKTRFLRHLTPPILWHYMYEGSINPNNKEHERHLAEKFLIIMDEFDSQSDRRSEALKSLITRQAISIRRPYSINYFNAPRIATFCGTTNKDYFLRDATGGRRFLVADVIKINPERYEHLDRAYAQAYQLWKSGERFFLNEHDIIEVNEANMEFTEMNVEQELLLSNFRPVKDGEEMDYYLTASEIARLVCKLTKISFNPRVAQKIGSLLKRNGFKSGKSNGSQKYALKKLFTT